MKTATEELVRKVDDLENRACHSNLRMVGLPEVKEGANMCDFLEKKKRSLKCMVNTTFPDPYPLKGRIE